LSRRPCLPCCRRYREPVGPLRSTGIAPLRRYDGPIRHPLAVRPLPIAGYGAHLTPPLSRWGEEGFSSCSTCPRHRAVALTPSERAAASARCDDPYRLRLSTVRLSLRSFSFSGPPLRSLPLRPGDSLTILAMALSMGFSVSVSFHAAIRVTGLWLLPWRDCLPLNTSAFSGRTVDDQLEFRGLFAETDEPPARKPMRGAFPACCASATSGAASNPATPVTKTRRFICSAFTSTRGLHRVVSAWETRAGCLRRRKANPSSRRPKTSA